MRPPQAEATASPEVATRRRPDPRHRASRTAALGATDLGSRAPFDFYPFSMPARGRRPFSGTVGEDCSADWLTLQWAPDRGQVLITDELGQETLTLDTPTAAGRDLTFICCDSPDRRLGGRRVSLHGW